MRIRVTLRVRNRTGSLYWFVIREESKRKKKSETYFVPNCEIVRPQLSIRTPIRRRVCSSRRRELWEGGECRFHLSVRDRRGRRKGCREGVGMGVCMGWQGCERIAVYENYEILKWNDNCLGCTYACHWFEVLIAVEVNNFFSYLTRIVVADGRGRGRVRSGLLFARHEATIFIYSKLSGRFVDYINSDEMIWLLPATNSKYSWTAGWGSREWAIDNSLYMVVS